MLATCNLVLNNRLAAFIASPRASDAIFLTDGANGVAKADPACIEKSCDFLTPLFKLFHGKLPANASVSAALETLDKNFDYKLTERFAKGSARVFVKYEVEKLRMIHANALRMCRRSKISKNYPRINQLRKLRSIRQAVRA